MTPCIRIVRVLYAAHGLCADAMRCDTKSPEMNILIAHYLCTTIFPLMVKRGHILATHFISGARTHAGCHRVHTTKGRQLCKRCRKTDRKNVRYADLIVFVCTSQAKQKKNKKKRWNISICHAARSTELGGFSINFGFLNWFAWALDMSESLGKSAFA